MNLMNIPGTGIPATELPGSMACYRLYGPAVSASAAAASTDLLDTVPVQVGIFGAISQADDTVLFYGMECLSNAGRSSNRTVLRVAIDADGAVVTYLPNALISAFGHPAADGAILVDAVYDANGAQVVATSVQVAEITAGVPDWESPVAVIPVSAAGLSAGSALTTTTWAHGTTVELAARAVTADDVAGPITLLPDVIADTQPPNAVSMVIAEVS